MFRLCHFMTAAVPGDHTVITWLICWWRWCQQCMMTRDILEALLGCIDPISWIAYIGGDFSYVFLKHVFTPRILGKWPNFTWAAIFFEVGWLKPPSLRWFFWGSHQFWPQITTCGVQGGCSCVEILGVSASADFLNLERHFYGKRREPEASKPLKIQAWQCHGGLVQMIFRFQKRWFFRYMLVFQGVFRACWTLVGQHLVFGPENWRWVQIWTAMKRDQKDLKCLISRHSHLQNVFLPSKNEQLF